MKRLVTAAVAARVGGLCLLLLLVARPSIGQESGFAPTAGPMTSDRIGDRAAVLLDGTVLITGGASSSGVLSTADIYNPWTGVFIATDGPMTAPRYAHTATRLNDGTVLLVGGSSDSSSAELYDPSTRTFRLGRSTAVTNVPRFGSVATLLNDGRVLIIGGAGVEDSAEFYDPLTGMFTLTSGHMMMSRSGYKVTVLNDGRVLITGGGTSTAEVFDPASNTFRLTTGLMTEARAYHTSTTLPNGKVLIVGGWNTLPLGSAELYDPVTDTFAPTGSLAIGRLQDGANLLPDGSVLITAGDWNNIGEARSDAELYNPAEGRFTRVFAMTGPRYNHDSVSLANGDVLVAGGQHNNQIPEYLASAEVFTNRPNTLMGAGVGVPLDNGITTTFDAVTGTGTTSVTTTTSAPALPAGFTLDGSTYFDVTTTATFSGGVTICFTYGTSVADPATLLLLHFVNGAWANVTTSNTVATRQLCGRVASFSPFAIVRPVSKATIQPPVNADGSSVFNANRGVVPVKFTLTVGGTSTCQLPSATISVFRTSGGTLGAINESDFIQSADQGLNFRVSGCQYAYSLGSKSLGVGTYGVNISIGASTAGTGTFSLK